MLYLEYIKKYLWVVRLVVLALCAYLAANAVSIYIRGKIVTAPTVNLAAAAAGGSAYTSINVYDIVLKRSLFNSAGVNLEAGFTARDSGPTIGSEDFVLMGVIAGLPDLSYAVINTRHNGETAVFRVGDTVADVADVLAIRAREVELLHDGERKVISLPDLGEGLSSAGDRWNRTVGEAVADGIKKVGENEFVVSSEVIENAFEDMASMLRGARIMPHIENGQIDGFKIHRIKSSSLYKKIGLQNGDILHRVNSIEIKGPEDGLRLFQELRTAKNISIDVTRKGSRQTLSYTVK
ncbi:MAG: type II secretion system protein GspC [Candidatus Lernaella stagnicola]|nr:type II secretion system protein GspC [Candidatus Lernaella stagnicola]